jgi:hypothetical protein
MSAYAINGLSIWWKTNEKAASDRKRPTSLTRALRIPSASQRPIVHGFQLGEASEEE